MSMEFGCQTGLELSNFDQSRTDGNDPKGNASVAAAVSFRVISVCPALVLLWSALVVLLWSSCFGPALVVLLWSCFGRPALVFDP
jgi:hypothetical protein